MRSAVNRFSLTVKEIFFCFIAVMYIIWEWILCLSYSVEHPIFVDLHKFSRQKQTIWWSAHIGSIFSWSKSILIELNKHVWFTLLLRFIVFSLPRDELSIDRMFYKDYIISNYNTLSKGLICFYAVEHITLVYRRFLSGYLSLRSIFKRI